MSKIFRYGTEQLTISIALGIASGNIKGILDDSATKKINAAAQAVKDIVAQHKTVYGINTGFGILANTKISKEDTITLQHKILQSHSVGVGDPIHPEIAKLMLITKVQSLAQGYSGVQLTTLERIIWHIDHNIIPVVPEKGSVGASGDLAPIGSFVFTINWIRRMFY